VWAAADPCNRVFPFSGRAYVVARFYFLPDTVAITDVNGNDTGSDNYTYQDQGSDSFSLQQSGTFAGFGRRVDERRQQQNVGIRDGSVSCIGIAIELRTWRYFGCGANGETISISRDSFPARFFPRT